MADYDPYKMPDEIQDNSTHTEHQLSPDSAATAAAHRVTNAVKPATGRKEGALTIIPMAALVGPFVLGHALKDTITRGLDYGKKVED